MTNYTVFDAVYKVIVRILHNKVIIKISDAYLKTHY